MPQIPYLSQREFSFASGKQLDAPANPHHLNAVRNQAPATTGYNL